MSLPDSRGSTGPRIDTTRRLARVLATDIAAAVLVFLFVAIAGLLWVLVMAPLFVVCLVIWAWMARERRRPLTDTDRYCSSVDMELDEIEARRAQAAWGDEAGAVVIEFPRRPAA